MGAGLRQRYLRKASHSDSVPETLGVQMKRELGVPLKDGVKEIQRLLARRDLFATIKDHEMVDAHEAEIRRRVQNDHRIPYDMPGTEQFRAAR